MVTSRQCSVLVDYAELWSHESKHARREIATSNKVRLTKSVPIYRIGSSAWRAEKHVRRTFTWTKGCTGKNRKEHKKQVKAKNTDNQAKAKQQGIGPGADQFYCFLSHILLAVVWYCVTNQENGYGTKKKKKPNWCSRLPCAKEKNQQIKQSWKDYNDENGLFYATYWRTVAAKTQKYTEKTTNKS